jgi:CRISPR-associated protein Csm2
MSFQNQGRGGGYGGSRGGGPGAGPRPASPGGPSRQDAKDEIKAALQSPNRVEYRGSDGKLRRDLLDKEAQAAAIALENISPTQLRRFFEQVGAIKRRIEVDPEGVGDSEVLAQVAFLKASAAYAAARSKENENKPVLEFVVKHANSIKTRPDFLDFHRHFETVVAFHKVYGKDKKEN